jgi:hypothetical protein
MAVFHVARHSIFRANGTCRRWNVGCEHTRRCDHDKCSAAKVNKNLMQNFQGNSYNADTNLIRIAARLFPSLSSSEGRTPFTGYRANCVGFYGRLQPRLKFPRDILLMDAAYITKSRNSPARAHENPRKMAERRFQHRFKIMCIVEY